MIKQEGFDFVNRFFICIFQQTQVGQSRGRLRADAFFFGKGPFAIRAEQSVGAAGKVNPFPMSAEEMGAVCAAVQHGSESNLRQQGYLVQNQMTLNLPLVGGLLDVGQKAVQCFEKARVRVFGLGEFFRQFGGQQGCLQRLQPSSQSAEERLLSKLGEHGQSLAARRPVDDGSEGKYLDGPVKGIPGAA